MCHCMPGDRRPAPASGDSQRAAGKPPIPALNRRQSPTGVPARKHVDPLVFRFLAAAGPSGPTESKSRTIAVTPRLSRAATPSFASGSLESETGSGKTETAVLRFAALWRAGLVDGLYFAVPTRAAAYGTRWTDCCRQRPPCTSGRPGFPAHAGTSHSLLSEAASPHTRGWTQVALDLAAPRLSFPAHAGNGPLGLGAGGHSNTLISA